MKKRKISKWRIKRGVNFSDEMRKGKYGRNLTWKDECVELKKNK